MKPKEQSLTELLNTVIPICNYKGCIVTRLIGGYEVFGKKYLTPQEVDKAIDDNCNSIDQSILKNETNI